MHKKQLKQAAAALEDNFNLWFCANTRITPKEMPEIAKGLPCDNLESLDVHRHFIWICRQIAVFADDDKLSKASRWLGFAQGAAWALGFTSINQMRKLNMEVADEP